MIKSMQEGFCGFLKQVFFFNVIQPLTWEKSFTASLVGSTFRSPKRIKLSYFELKSRFLPRSFRCDEIKRLWGLYEQRRNHFFFLMLISI